MKPWSGAIICVDDLDGESIRLLRMMTDGESVIAVRG